MFSTWFRNTHRDSWSYFFFNVKKERFFGSSLRPCSGSVWDLPAPPAAPSSCMATWLMALTHCAISSSLVAWNKYSPQFANLSDKFQEIVLRILSFIQDYNNIKLYSGKKLQCKLTSIWTHVVSFCNLKLFLMLHRQYLLDLHLYMYLSGRTGRPWYPCKIQSWFHVGPRIPYPKTLKL